MKLNLPLSVVENPSSHEILQAAADISLAHDAFNVHSVIPSRRTVSRKIMEQVINTKTIIREKLQSLIKPITLMLMLGMSTLLWVRIKLLLHYIFTMDLLCASALQKKSTSVCGMVSL